MVPLLEQHQNHPIGRSERTATLKLSSVGLKKTGRHILLPFVYDHFLAARLLKNLNENNDWLFFPGNKDPGDCSEGWYCAVNQTLRIPVTLKPSFVFVTWTKAQQEAVKSDSAMLYGHSLHHFFPY